MSCIKSFSSPDVLIYTVPIAIQPSSGEISIAVQIPQKENRSAKETINRLSVERFLWINSFINRPQIPPSASTTRFLIIGRMMSVNLTAEPVVADTAIEIAILVVSHQFLEGHSGFVYHFTDFNA